jgi:hypothetical protein
MSPAFSTKANDLGARCLRCVLDALFQIICDAHIKGVVSTAEDVAIVHAEGLSRCECWVPLGKLGTKFLQTKILEAGGVEVSAGVDRA